MINLVEKIDEIMTLLSNEQLEKDIIEIENNPENESIIRYLEKIGSQKIRYELNSEFRPDRLQEKEGGSNLWYKKTDGSWVIRLWDIKRLVYRGD